MGVVSDLERECKKVTSATAEALGEQLSVSSLRAGSWISHGRLDAATAVKHLFEAVLEREDEPNLDVAARRIANGIDTGLRRGSGVPPPPSPIEFRLL